MNDQEKYGVENFKDWINSLELPAPVIIHGCAADAAKAINAFKYDEAKRFLERIKFISMHQHETTKKLKI